MRQIHKSMKQRLITALILIIIALPIVIFSNYIIYPITLSVLAARTIFELLRVFGVERNMLVSLPAYLIAIAFPQFGYFIEGSSSITGYLAMLAASVFVYMLLLMGISVFSKGKITFSKISEIFITITYVVVAFSSLSLLRYIDKDVGVYLIVLACLVSWLCDAGAYAIGMMFGKHKLIPEISPKKTVEGAIGGIVTATFALPLYGLALDMILEGIQVNYLYLFILGFFLSIVSQLGDLVASLIKREYGVKDYGRIFPGHGGVMDRFDSLLAVTTVLLIFNTIFPPFTF